MAGTARPGSGLRTRTTHPPRPPIHLFISAFQHFSISAFTQTMLYLIQIHWIRRHPELDRPDAGTTTYAEFARSLAAAKRKASSKFRRHYGQHLAAQTVCEKPDPAGIYDPEQPPRIDCGHNHPYGICPNCNRGHGIV
jgi:hypothetical protein